MPIPTEPSADGTYHLSLAQLSSFDYQMPSEAEIAKAVENPKVLPDQIPATLRALEGKRVSIDGFILPLDMGEREIRRFVLSPSVAGCCWGGPTKMNDWIDVHVPTKKLGARLIKFDPTIPVTIVGTLTMGEVIDEGFIASLYRMEAEDVRPRAPAAGS